MRNPSDLPKQWAHTQLDAVKAGIHVPAWAIRRALWLLGDLA